MRDWRGTTALVTGATGFIGAHLAGRLHAHGARVHATSRHHRPAAQGGTRWHRTDLRDPDATAALVAAVEPDVVFHLASEVTGTRDVGQLLPIMRGNLTSAVNLLTAVATMPTPARTVLAGSIEEPRPHDEDQTPSSPYAAAKWAATGYARTFHRLYGVPATVLRVAMVYGPAQPDTRKLVPYATLALLDGQPPRVSSGTRLIDWVYVDDVVDAFLAAAEAPDAGHVVDIGSGTALSIRDTVGLLVKVADAGVEAEFGAVADRPLDSARIADPGPAAELLGWRATTPLDEGLRRTVEWYRHNRA